MTTTARLIVACSLAILPLADGLAEDDQIYMKRGASIGGAIAGSTADKIAIESRGQQQTVNVNEVRVVTFGDEPQELRQGRARAVGGKYDSALDDLKRVNPASIERAIIKRDLQFYLAYCEGRLALTAGGDKAKATASMLAFVKAAPKSFHFFDAATLLGDLAVGQGDFAGAVKYYGAISARAPWPEYKMSASLAEARALMAQDKFAEAEAKFDSVIGQKSDSPEAKRQALLAQVGKGRCLAETNSPAAGLELIETIIKDNDASDAELFGRAYNAHGDCLQKAGKPKEALMSYLHVDVLFYADPDIHAESLYHLSKLWATLKKPDRASSTRNLLDQRYSGSVWSKRE